MLSDLKVIVIAACDQALCQSVDRHGCYLQLDWCLVVYNHEAVIPVLSVQMWRGEKV